MINANKHIVSSIKWEMGFDQKDEAVKLQSQISSWSKVDLLKEMNEVFELLCPAEQTWSIEGITLDIGPVDETDLKNTLLRKIKAALTARLLEMAYTASNEQQAIKVYELDTSQINLLEKYLELGYMPWNQIGMVSVNDLLNTLFIQNKIALMAMLRIKGKSRTVRKRMAWQFQEAAIRKIIQELEPGNHVQIIEMTDELNKLRKKEAIVQTSAVAFRKQIWFWVLNHLYTERGTLFNQLDFMDSSIRQMAQHFNMDYDVLFQKIEIAVDRMGGKSIIRADFLKTLELLSQRRKKGGDRKGDEMNGEDVKRLNLKKLMARHNHSSNTQKKVKLDELIVGLYRENPDQLKAIICREGSDVSTWEFLLKSVKKASLLLMVKAMVRNNVHVVSQVLTLLEKTQSGTAGEREKRRRSALVMAYLVKNQSTSFQEKDFLNYMITHAVTGEKNESVFQNLFKLDRQNGDQAEIDPSIYMFMVNALSERLMMNNRPDNATFMLEKAIQHLFRASVFSGDSIQMNDREALRLCAFWLTKDPKRTVELIGNQAKSPLFISRFYQVIDQRISQQILHYMDAGNSRLILQLATTFSRSVNNVSSNEIERLKVVIWQSGLLQLILTPAIAVADLIVQIIYRTRKRYESFDQLKVDWEAIFQDNALFVTEWSAEQRQKVIAVLKDRKDSWNHNRKAPEEMIQWLKIQGKRNKFFFETLDRPSMLECLDLLFPNKSQEVLNITERQHRIFNRLPFVRDMQETTFHTILFNVLIDYKTYQGNVITFERLLKSQVKELQSLEKVQDRQLMRDRSVKKAVNQSKNVNFIKNYLFSSKSDKMDESTFRETLEKCLLLEVKAFRSEVLPKLTESKQLDVFQKNLSCEFFVQAVFEFGNTSERKIKEALLFLLKLQSNIRKSSLQAVWELKLWELAIASAVSLENAEKSVIRIFRDMLTSLTLEKEMDAKELMLLVKTKIHSIPDFFKESMIDMNKQFSAVFKTKEASIPVSKTVVNRIQESEGLRETIRIILVENRLPRVIQEMNKITVSNVLKIILQEEPIIWYSVWKELKLNAVQIDRMLHLAPMESWVDAIVRIFPEKRTDMERLHDLFQVLSQAHFKGVSGRELQLILFKKLMKACKNNYWRVIDPTYFWSELNWDLQVRFNLTNEQIENGLERLKPMVPPAYRLSLSVYEEAGKNRKAKGRLQAANESILKEATVKSYFDEEQKVENVAVTNAGIVIVNSYIKTLFDRLGLLEGNEFKSEEAKEKGVHYLQYIVNGLTVNEEHHLVLNKVLCGIHPSTPILGEIEIAANEKELINGMVKAIINYWPAIGKCSVDGFRGNWIIREGLLSEKDDRWDLNVEKKAYDILLHQSPFSFSIIKHPWMDKPVHVNWAY